MSEIANIFFGVPQSRYAALAILLAIVVVALTIIFGNSPVPMSQKFGFVLMVFLVSLPGLALSLFQLTCIVTGSGFKNQRWWCSVYAWVLSAIMIFYAVLLVIAAVMSLSSKNKETFKLNNAHFTNNSPARFANREHFNASSYPMNKDGAAAAAQNMIPTQKSTADVEADANGAGEQVNSALGVNTFTTNSVNKPLTPSAENKPVPAASVPAAGSGFAVEQFTSYAAW